MRLVVFGHNDWWTWEGQGFSTRNAALIRELAGRDEVGQISIVDSPRFRGRTHRPVERRHEDTSPVAARVTAVRYGYSLPLPSTWRYGRRLNEKLAHGTLLRRLATASSESEVTVLWVADPRLVAAAVSVPHDVFVFDAIDDWRHHPWAGYAAVRHGYEIAAHRAGVVFAVHPRLLDVLRPTGYSEVLFNAVDSAPWATARPSSEFAGASRPLVGYVGMIQQRVDALLLATVARRLPHATFVLVGQVSSGCRRLMTILPPNVRLLGHRPYHQVPALVAAWDACIVPHRRDGLTDTMDPLKLYEYLASGKPVVSTVTSPNPVIASHVRVATMPDAFAAALAEEVELDDGERRAARRKAVHGQTWAARASRALHVIEEASRAIDSEVTW